MKRKGNNYAFIDSQNINLGFRALGWQLDWKRFRVYLADKYGVTTAYLFIGYLAENQNLYRKLQKADYILIFKPVLRTKSGKIKGNVDAELVLQAMIEYDEYDRGVIVTSDGDFACLVRYLDENKKLERVLSPAPMGCSALLKDAAKHRIDFMNQLKSKLQHHE